MTELPNEVIQRIERLLLTVGSFYVGDADDKSAIGCQLWASEIREARKLATEIRAGCAEHTPMEG